jgi:benzoate/toluate 1,2-dioxygenase beta subunit
MTISYEEVQRFIAREGYLLDAGRFEEWLDLYSEGASYWVPAWDDDSNEQTRDPQKEISLMYYANRDGLADRVFRLRTGKSAASTPLFRTTHITGNLVIEVSTDDACTVSCAWVTHSYRQETSLTYFGNSEYRLGRVGGELKILGKKVILKNDRIDQVLDVYQI